MSLFEMKLPDVGEGVAEAELVEWLVEVGEQVTPDTVIAEVLTDKATVEVSAPVHGEVVTLHGEPGDVLAVGGKLIGIETGSDAPATEDAPDEDAPTEDAPDDADEPAREPEPEPTSADSEPDTSTRPQHDALRRATAAPAVRARAAGLGLDLGTIAGTGPDGRVVHADLDRELTRGRVGSSPMRTQVGDGQHDVAVRGVRRKIAERLTEAWRDIPHITYVDDIDATDLEQLRSELNGDSQARGVRLTILPFLARAIVLALADQPGLNANYDHGSEMLRTFDAVHLGIATQTDDGLRVPVVRHAEGFGVRGLASEIGRVTEAARNGSATRDELTGSTITITSLGALGGIATTPIINPPEVAIVGVNKMETRPVWQDGSFRPRQVFNLSSSFDHRMVDGWDAAMFVQRIKRLLETPALLFVTDD